MQTGTLNVGEDGLKCQLKLKHILQRYNRILQETRNISQQLTIFAIAESNMFSKNNLMLDIDFLKHLKAV